LVSNCYGATVVGLLAQLALSGLFWTEEEGNDFIERWFNLYPEVHEYMDLQHYRARRYGLVWDLFGRIRLVPEVQSTHSWIRNAGLRQAGNMPIQSIAAGQMKLVMGMCEGEFERIWREEKVWCWPLLTIHDQLIVEVDEDERKSRMVDEVMAEQFENVMRDVESGEYRFRVPIKSDGEIVKEWRKD
jgi:DNA polymerase-1